MPTETVQMISQYAKLALEYGPKREPSKTLQDILSRPRDTDLLYHALKRTLFWLLQRSGAPEDYERTIFDKFLIELWNEGKPKSNVALLDLFLDEYVIIKNSNEGYDHRIIVTAYLEAQRIIDEFITGNHPVALTPPGAATDTDEDAAYKTSHAESADSMGKYTVLEAPRQAKTAAKDDALDRMIQVYHAAKADYYLGDANKTGISHKSTDKFTNVRFLRDTAENLLRCLKAQTGNHHLIREVERVVTASCEHAEHLAGGRKRIFEDPEDEQLARHRKSQRHNQENRAGPHPSHPSDLLKDTRVESSKRARTSHHTTDRYRGEAYRENRRSDRDYEWTDRRFDRSRGGGRPIWDRDRDRGRDRHLQNYRSQPLSRPRSRANPAGYAMNLNDARDTCRDDHADHDIRSQSDDNSSLHSNVKTYELCE